MASGSQITGSLYEDDLFEWSRQQAQLLRERRFADLDLEHLAEEVESVGASEKREIRNQLKVILAHLLKWRYQPGARSSGWRGTIDEQRSKIADVLADSPSLQHYPVEIFDTAYLSGRLLAAKDTGIDFTLFPERPPFTIEQVLDSGYYPKQPDLLDQS